MKIVKISYFHFYKLETIKLNDHITSMNNTYSINKYNDF